MIPPIRSIYSSSSFKWWVYVTVATGTAITVAEQTASSIVIPRISEEFGADIATAQWMPITYMLIVCTLMMPAAKIVDYFGQRRVWIGGLYVLAFASLFIAFSQSFSMILVGKAIMALGASAVQANGIAMMASSFPEHERGKAMGLHMTAVGVGAVGGPLVGGIDSLFDWRAVFIFVGIFQLVANVIAMLVLTDKGRKKVEADLAKSRKFDWRGVLLSMCFLIAFMLSVSLGNKLGWFSLFVLGGLGISVVILIIFIFEENKSSNPLLPLYLFRIKSFSLGSLARFLCFMAGSSVFFLLPFFLVSGVGMTTARAATYMLPSAVTMALFGPFSGRIADRIGNKIPSLIGMFCSTLAMYIFSTITLDSNPLIISVAAALSGTGLSIFMAPNTTSIMGEIDRAHYGVISAFMNLTRNSAHIVGIAIPTAVVVLVMSNLGYEADLSDPQKLIDLGLRTSYVSGMQRAFQVSLFFMVLAMVVTGLVPKTQTPSFNPDDKRYDR